MDSNQERISSGLQVIPSNGITVHKSPVEELRKNNVLCETLVEIALEGVSIVDPEETITFTNPAFAKMLGYTREDLMGRNLRTLVSEEDWSKIRRETQKRCRSESSRYEVTLLGNGDIVRSAIVSAVPLFGEDGEFTGTLGVVTDITERKKAEEELRQSCEKLRTALDKMVKALAAAFAMRDPYTAGHQRRVTSLACAIGEEMGLPADQIEGLRIAGLIHDIGKINVPAEILSKPGPVDGTEFDLIKKHPRMGYDILKEIEFPWPVAQIILQHHERMDGSGYPQGLKGEEILLEARILALADVVEAMSSHRPYREALGIDTALEEISKNKVKYDTQVVDVCLKFFEGGFEFEDK